MNLTTTQRQALARGQRVRPDFNMFVNIGQEVARQLKPIRSTTEVAKNLGMKPQAVHVIGCVALGKIAYALRKLEQTERAAK